MSELAITMGSLFDGSGGFPEAARRHGMTPVFASEVEPYPIAVTRSRFPGMEHLGNILTLRGDQVMPVVVVTFGSPCQDLSVAGKQAGIHAGTRSNLFFEAIRFFKEMREKTHGKYPRIVVWENVPGAFSSHKGEDFRAVLQALAEIGCPEVSIPMPEKGKWAKAGCIVGDGWSIAWRTYDAQFWGVPQRRKRIYLIADFGSERAGEILFEREGVRGYFVPSGAQGQGAAENAQGSPASDDRAGDSASSSRPQNLHAEQGGDPARHTDGEGGHPRAHGNAPAAGEGIGLESAGRGLDAVVPFAANQRDEVRELGDKAGAIQAQPGMKQQTFLAYAIDQQGGKGGANYAEGVMPTLCSDSHGTPHAVAYSFDSLASNSMKSKNPHSGCRAVEVAKTLDTSDQNPSKNQGGIAVVEAVPYTLKIRCGKEGGGKGALIQTDQSATLATNNDQYLFQPVPRVVEAAGFKAGQSSGGIGWQDECATTLAAECSGTEPTVCIKCGGFCSRASAKARGVGWEEEMIPTLRASVTPDVAYSVENHPAYSLQGNIIDRNAQQNGSGICENVSHTVNAVDRHGVAYCVGNGQLNQISMAEQSNSLDCMHDQQAVVVFDKEVYNSGVNSNGGHYISDDGIAPTLRTMHPPGVATQYIVRRLTPTECARLQGFPDTWGHPGKKDSFTPEECVFWQDVRNTHAAINGKQVKDYTEAQMLKWYNGLHTDSAEYKMWGNGIALPCAEDVMGRIAKHLRREWLDTLLGGGT